MMTRRMVLEGILLSCSFGMFLKSDTIRAEDTQKAANAFEEMVRLMRKPDWTKNMTIAKQVVELAQTAGFNTVLDNTVVKFDDKGKAHEVVTVTPDQIMFSKDARLHEKIFNTVEDAVTEIYGVSKL